MATRQRFGGDWTIEKLDILSNLWQTESSTNTDNGSKTKKVNPTKAGEHRGFQDRKDVRRQDVYAV